MGFFGIKTNTKLQIYPSEGVGWQGLEKNKRFLRLGGAGYNFKDMGEKKSRLPQFILRCIDKMM